MKTAIVSFIAAASAATLTALAAPLAHAMDAHPWVAAPPRLAKETYFSNLRDGATVEAPFLVKFGLSGMGLAPITKAQAHTGHHHLLVNRDLPMEFSKPLPFNDSYIHFGKGQMEAALNLAPGEYTLRLVLADDKHIPNFVYSKPLKITVTKKNAGVEPASLSKPGIELMLSTAQASVGEPLRVQFHASKFNVSHAALREANTGHFRLRVAGEGGKSESFDFSGGQTETWLKPPAGRYTATLELVDNLDPKLVLATSAPASLTVAAR